MDILLKEVTIVDSSSPFHLQTTDVFFQSGYVVEIGSITRSADKTLNLPNLYVSPGWVDVFSDFSDPGGEANETLGTGSLAAAYGGFTDVFLLPNTVPVIDSKSGIEYIIQNNRDCAVTLHPLAAVSKNTKGTELAEMYDMKESGAVAFTDGLHSIQSAGVLLKALQYVKAIDGTIIQVPLDYSIAANGLMNEGIASTKWGLAGSPALAEEVSLARDLELARYTGSKIHFTGISTRKSVELIRWAKAGKVQVSCSVTPYHLYFTDEDVAVYDTHLKVTPPLRTSADRDALREAVLDGTIDCFASHHFPRHRDFKMVEFEYARNGMIGLETLFAAVTSSLPRLSIEQCVNLMSAQPRKLFGLSQPTIALQEPACFSLFQPEAQWTPDTFYSRSKNSAFYGKSLTGKPVGIINKDNLFLRP